MSIADSFNTLGADMQKSTFTSITLVAVLLLLCCFVSWFLWLLTGLFVVYATYLGYNLFKPKKSLKIKPGGKLS